MRNIDVAPARLTSLGWAAVLGHEETFEFLLVIGHDDAELSRVWVIFWLECLLIDMDLLGCGE